MLVSVEIILGSCVPASLGGLCRTLDDTGYLDIMLGTVHLRLGINSFLSVSLDGCDCAFQEHGFV